MTDIYQQETAVTRETEPMGLPICPYCRAPMKRMAGPGFWRRWGPTWLLTILACLISPFLLPFVHFIGRSFPENLAAILPLSVPVLLFLGAIVSGFIPVFGKRRYCTTCGHSYPIR